MTKRILFLCVHNAARSQMAEALCNAQAQERRLDVRAVSAGTMGGQLNPVAVEAMEEIGVPMAGQVSKILTPEMVEDAHLLITMGCGVDATSCPARFLATEDWNLEDPAGRPIEFMRRIRDDISVRVRDLLDRVSAQ